MHNAIIITVKTKWQMPQNFIVHQQFVSNVKKSIQNIKKIVVSELKQSTKAMTVIIRDHRQFIKSLLKSNFKTHPSDDHIKNSFFSVCL